MSRETLQADEFTDLQTQKLMNLQTHKPKVHKLTNLQTQKLTNSQTHEPMNSKAHELKKTKSA